MSIENDPKRVFTTVQRQQIWVNSKLHITLQDRKVRTGEYYS